MFRVRAVSTDDDDVVDTLTELHRLTFVDGSPVPDFELGDWWVAATEGKAAAFIGIQKSTHVRNAGYFSRVGVLPCYRGNGLQRRLMGVMERRARALGWEKIVSDTTDNIPSANNMIACGYRMFAPGWAWSFVNAIYWVKSL